MTLEPKLGFPELTELGRKIEMLRIARGVSKQHLARYVGTSRQQIWRVMTGKSDLSVSLRDRLAQVLSVEPGYLTGDAIEVPGLLASPATATVAAPPSATFQLHAGTPELAQYLSDARLLRVTLASLPCGSDGLRLKRMLLNALEDLAIERGLPLSEGFFDARRQVLMHEL